jgi:hypothetical protein
MSVNLVLHTNVIGGTTTALTVTGTTVSGTVCGNLTGGAAGALVDNHSTATNIFYVIGNISAGSGNYSYGYELENSGSVNITGNSISGTGANASGIYLHGGGTVNITGNCTGSNTQYHAIGCFSDNNTVILNITGNLINGLLGPAVSGGLLHYTPASTNYILSPKDASYTLGTIDAHATVMPADPGSSNVKSGVVYGPYTGTYAGGGAVVAGTSGW